MVLNFESEIDILLFDQNKIVTYKELSSKFSFTPFEARKTLSKYIAAKKKSNNESQTFFITYLIIGEKKQTNIKKVFLTNESDLDKTKDDFKILSKQIYSIQSNEITDFDIIYGSDLDASNNVNRKCNLKISTKLGPNSGVGQMEVETVDNDDDLMMKMDIQPAKTKPTETSTKSKPKEDQENKPVEATNKKTEKVEVKKESVLKDMDQILPKEEPKEMKKSVFQNDAKKPKLAENNPAETKPAVKPAAKGKKTLEPAKNQKTMMSFFKKA